MSNADPTERPVSRQASGRASANPEYITGSSRIVFTVELPMAHREFIEIRLRKFYPETSIIVRQLRQFNCVTVTQCHILFPIPAGFI